MIYFPGKFIFIKPKKVAGTSMEILLSAACDAYCMITPCSLGDEITRYELGYQLPVNVFPSKKHERELHQVIASAAALKHCDRGDQDSQSQTSSECPGFAKVKEEFFELKQELTIRNHDRLSSAQSLIDKCELDRIRKISICRHPYELAVSQAYWNIRKRKNGNTDFQYELDTIVSEEHKNNRQYFADGFDFDVVLRLEYLKTDLDVLKRICELDLPSEIPHAKGESRKDHRPAAKILTWSQRRKMRNSNPRLFELWENPPQNRP